MLSAERLRARAEIIGRIRDFFAARGVLEVHTPVITDSGVTDLHIESLALSDGRFLRTSPEYAHKRLLAAGAGDLFELGPVFRAGEHGRRHREEFTLLEWYRLDWDWQALATEVLELIDHVVPMRRWNREFVTWRELLLRETGIDLDTTTEAELRDSARDAPGGLAPPEILDWLFATRLQPALPEGRITVVHDFPACQAALARLKPGQPRWAERFEIFAGALELANGYRELTDPAEQQRRFDRDNLRRSAMGLKTMPVDRALIEAMERGLPDCSGVALGVDRLMMVALEVDDIARTRAL